MRELHRRDFDPAQHDRRVRRQIAEAQLLRHIAHALSPIASASREVAELSDSSSANSSVTRPK